MTASIDQRNLVKQVAKLYYDVSYSSNELISSGTYSYKLYIMAYEISNILKALLLAAKHLSEDDMRILKELFVSTYSLYKNAILRDTLYLELKDLDAICNSLSEIISALPNICSLKEDNTVISDIEKELLNRKAVLTAVTNLQLIAICLLDVYKESIDAAKAS